MGIIRRDLTAARLSEIESHPDDFRLLERIPLTKGDLAAWLPFRLAEAEEQERTHHIVFLDTETTGIRHGHDRLIELGLVQATFAYDRRVLLSIDRIYNGFQDPHMPIPERITRLTGIDQSMTDGQQLDHEAVGELLAGRPLVVAHNASFDRPFFEDECPEFGDLSWACSLQIDWDMLGGGGRKLEYLCMQRGWFYDAHRACTDCLALAWLMSEVPEALDMLCDQALHDSCRLYLTGKTFDLREHLKELGYRFDGARRQWYIECREDEAREQLQAISGFYDPHQAAQVRITARERFKSG